MTIVDLLEHRHRDLAELFGQVEDAAASADHVRMRERFGARATAVIALMRAEHAIVYPRFAYLAGLHEEVVQARRVQVRIEAAINDLRLAPMTVDAWRATVAHLRRLITHHAETEAWILFPVAALRIGRDELARIGEEFLAFEAVAASTAGPSITYDLGAAAG